MQQLIQDLKNQTYKPMYLLYGEEDYLRKQYRDKLKAALTVPDDTMNYHYYEGKDIDIPQLIDLAETMPFFADRRVIILENSGLCKSGGDALAEYLKQPAQSVVVILVESQVDKRSKLFKVLKEQGRACEFVVQNEQTLKRWIASLAGQDNRKISEQTAEYFLEKTGTDMANIRTEWEKLICYTMGREIITSDDIDVICTQRVSNRIFDMVAAIAEKSGIAKKDAEKALAAFVDTVAAELKKGEKIQLVGFGTFEVRERAAREGINPLTKEKIKIAASKSPVFKAGKALKDSLN